MERDAPSPEPMVLLIHLYMSESPVKELSQEMGEKQSPSTEAHADGRPTYNGMRPGSPKGLFMTLLSLAQCIAAFSTIPHTLAWADHNPVSQHVT